MRWACAALLLLAAPAAAAQEDTAAQEGTKAARRLVLDASRALQAGNAARFLSYFDKRETPQFEQLRDHVVNVTATKVVASSVEIKASAAKGNEIRLSVDWLLQLSPMRELGAVEQRRQTVEVRVRIGKKPKIVFLDPIALFRPSSP